MHDSYALLAIVAETLNDIEAVRIATENRARALTHPDQKIELPEDHPAVLAAEGMATQLMAMEQQIAKQVAKEFRSTPIGKWAKGQIGLGDKQCGRLLGVIGDPARRYDQDSGKFVSRSIAQLRSYCGYGDARVQVRKKGQQGNWNPQAKMRVYLIAESCIKQAKSPYRKVYDEGRKRYAESKHEADCRRCGPSGSPAKAGSDLSDGHKHARAMRLVSKAILKDMWLAASSEG